MRTIAWSSALLLNQASQPRAPGTRGFCLPYSLRAQPQLLLPPPPRPLLRTNSENGTMPPATPSLDSPPGPCSRLLRRETGPHFRPGSRGALCPDLALPSRQSWGSRGRTGTAQEQWGGSPGSASCLICPHVCRCVPVLFFKEQGLDLGGRAPSRGTPSPCGLSCHARSSSLKRTTHAGRSCPPARSAAALRRARC